MDFQRNPRLRRSYVRIIRGLVQRKRAVTITLSLLPLVDFEADLRSSRWLDHRQRRPGRCEAVGTPANGGSARSAEKDEGCWTERQRLISSGPLIRRLISALLRKPDGDI